MKKKVCICIGVVLLAAATMVVWLEQRHGQAVAGVNAEGILEQSVDVRETIMTEEPQEVPRMVMIDGILYKDTGITSHVLKCGVMDGEISSTVGEGEQPADDNQSNFGTGYGYQRGAGRIEVYMDDKWCIFSQEALEWGIILEAKDVTPTGMTIVCTQSGGNSTGELQTGSYFILEKKENDEWTEVEWLQPTNNITWTMEAWVIPKENTTEWNVGWERLYGKLPAGIYRIGKSIIDFRDSGNYDRAMYYAEFAVVE